MRISVRVLRARRLDILHEPLNAQLYDQTTATRRRSMVAAFDAAIKHGHGLEGVLVNIPQSPFDVASKALEEPDLTLFPERQARAVQVRKWLGGDANEDRWRDIAEHNRSVKTTLAALPADSAQLLYHGYVLTAANLHVIFGTPLPALPTLKDFEAAAI